MIGLQASPSSGIRVRHYRPKTPLANAGSNQEVADSDYTGLESVTLDASSSSAVTGTISSYTWSENGEIIATGATPTVDLEVGTHVLVLSVTSSEGLTSEHSVVITITSDAWILDVFNEDDDISLDGRDPDIAPDGFAWEVVTGVVTHQNGEAEFTFPSQSNGMMVIEMGNDQLNTARAEFTLPSTGTNRQLCLVGRYLDNSNFTMAVMNWDNSTFRIIDNVAGAFNNRATSTLDGAPTAGRRYAIVYDIAGAEYQAWLYEDIPGDGTWTEVGLSIAQPITWTQTAPQGDYTGRTHHGLRAVNTTGSGGPISVSVFALLIPDDEELEADVQATVSPSSFRTSVTTYGMSIVDDDLLWEGTLTQRNLARTHITELDLDEVVYFLESFGNSPSLGAFGAFGEGVENVPEPDLSDLDSHMAMNHSAFGNSEYTIYCHRLPWQFTGGTEDGVTNLSDAGDYNSEGRRVQTNRSDQYIEWLKRCAMHLMVEREVNGVTLPAVTRFACGSEWKGFQGRARDDIGQKWDFEDYAGTPDACDMGFIHYFELFHTAIMSAADELQIPRSNITLLGPYPVVAHRGASSNADTVTFNSRNDTLGNPVDYSVMNYNNATYNGWGGVNKAALEGVDEFLMSWFDKDLDRDSFEFSVDFGTFNAGDHLAVPGISSHDLAYLRSIRHLTWYDQRLDARGWGTGRRKHLAEVYWKAQNPMDDQTTYPDDFISETLRDTYQASVKSMGLYACLETGGNPIIWSPYGRGDQSSPIGGSDPNQWYGGVVVRPGMTLGSRTGGSAMSFKTVYGGFKEHFPSGTALHEITFTDDTIFAGVGSPSMAAVTNKTGNTVTLLLDGVVYTFTPYQVRFLSHTL